ncbi:MAG: hypothetical protein Q7T40_06190 [Methylobacter sp.]|nr:hypothetical protein [Methylobacter sp.]
MNKPSLSTIPKTGLAGLKENWFDCSAFGGGTRVGEGDAMAGYSTANDCR